MHKKEWAKHKKKHLKSFNSVVLKVGASPLLGVIIVVNGNVCWIISLLYVEGGGGARSNYDSASNERWKAMITLAIIISHWNVQYLDDNFFKIHYKGFLRNPSLHWAIMFVRAGLFRFPRIPYVVEKWWLLLVIIPFHLILTTPFNPAAIFLFRAMFFNYAYSTAKAFKSYILQYTYE